MAPVLTSDIARHIIPQPCYFAIEQPDTRDRGADCVHFVGPSRH
jgi:hypothetical protein